MPHTSHGGHADAINPLSIWQTGQYTIVQANTPEALPDLPGDYVAVKALPGNSGPIELRAGGAANGWPLAAGKETGLLPLDNAAQIHVVGAAGDGVAYYVAG